MSDHVFCGQGNVFCILATTYWRQSVTEFLQQDSKLYWFFIDIISYIILFQGKNVPRMRVQLQLSSLFNWMTT